MPYLDSYVVNATLDTNTVVPTKEKYARLQRNQSGSFWSRTDNYQASGVVTFENFAGWALRLPPHTFEPIFEIENKDIRDFSDFGRWSDWTIVAGATDVTYSDEYQVFGEECRVDRDTGVATATVSRTANLYLRSDDVMEFKIRLPSNATGLAVILHSGAGSARYVEFTPLANDWNLVLIEIDQPTSTSAPWDLTAVDAISVEVTFTGVVASYFAISSAVLDRTAQKGGEIRWQVSLDSGSTWIGWNGVAWAAGVYCHHQWIERRLSLLTPASGMQWQVRCRLIPSENLKHTPTVYGIVCGLDFDEHFNTEEDLKRSIQRQIETTDIYLRMMAFGDGSTTVYLRTHFDNPVVTAVYLGGMRTVDTTDDLFTSQGATTSVTDGFRTPLLLDTAVANGSRVVIHYTVKPPVKIAASNLLIDSAVPEVNLVFPSHGNENREGEANDVFVNRSLGYVWTGFSANRETFVWEIYCTANDSMTVGAMEDGIRRDLESGFASDATGFTWFVGDMLPADVESNYGQGLNVRLVKAESIGPRWRDLTMTRIRQVRALLPNVGILPKRGYVK